MNDIYRLDTKAFRNKRIIWLLLMMLPSIIIDAVIVFRVITMHPVVLDAMEILDIKGIMMLFLANALLFKSEGVIIYFVMKSFRKKGEVRVSSQKVVYRKKRVVGYSFYYNYRIYIEYYITAPKAIKRRRNGTIVITGDIPVVYFMLNGKDVHSKKIKHRCVIPGYFENMDSIMKKLEYLAADKKPDLITLQ